MKNICNDRNTQEEIKQEDKVYSTQETVTQKGHTWDEDTHFTITVTGASPFGLVIKLIYVTISSPDSSFAIVLLSLPSPRLILCFTFWMCITYILIIYRLGYTTVVI